MPAMKNNAPHTSAISMPWPNSGGRTKSVTASSSRARAEREHDAAEHQRRERGEHRLVDRPPPAGKRAAFRAGDHQALSSIDSPASTPSSLRTSSRNADPRISKFGN